MKPQESPIQLEVLERLRNGKIGLEPIVLRLSDVNSLANGQGWFDGVVEATWAGKQWLFALEYKRRSTPKVFQETLAFLRSAPCPTNIRPLLVVPYLSVPQIRELEQAAISGVDLCGNGVIIVPGKLCIQRTGQPNRFPHSSPIKNIYRGRSSLVGRVFLARPCYTELKEIEREIKARSGQVNLSTISKAVTRLDEDLLVARVRGEMRLLQPDLLLDRLVTNYSLPREGRSFLGRCDEPPTEFLPRLFDLASSGGVRCVMTGASSALRYAVMAREGKVRLYCDNLDAITQASGSLIRGTARFANVEFIEARQDSVYFDARANDGIRWASPVQVVVELMAGDKREQETAEQVREAILKELRSQGEGLSRGHAGRAEDESA